MESRLRIPNATLYWAESRGGAAAWAPIGKRAALATAVLVAVAYYLGAKIGFALTFDPHPTSVLWPPNALLLSALLLLPMRQWWLPFLAALPAHLLAELQSGIPIAMVLGWFVSNCTEALLGATGIRALTRGPLRFDGYRQTCVFLLIGAILAPLLSSFVDSGLVKLIGWSDSAFWELVQVRWPSNALAALVVVPLVVSWATPVPTPRPYASAGRQAEAGVLYLGLLIAGALIFQKQFSVETSPALLYAPLPFLLWAAMRFGTRGISVAIAMVASLAIYGAMHGLGPFTAGSAAENTRSVQFFLIAVGAPLLLFAAVMTERKNARRVLQVSEERAIKVFQAGPDPMVLVRRTDQTIIDVNERWVRLFGYSRAEAVGRTSMELGIYQPSPGQANYLDLANRGLLRDFPIDFHDRNGHIRHTMLTGEFIEIGDTECLITIIRDVTAQKAIEGEAQRQRLELLHLSRVAMLGELSGALSHELNQPLTAILSNAQAAQRLLVRDRIESQDLKEILQDIVAQDKRAGNVILRLRALFKKGDAQFHAFDANDLVADVLALAHGTLTTRNLQVITRLAPHPVFVHGDRIQLQQVLLNLVVNACEAMDAPGSKRVLQIKTAPAPDRLVQIIVTDGGCGIPESAFPTLFDPFFTTKPQGLGLGLSISRSIISSHNGELLARNNSDGGATFRVVLPLWNGE